MSEHVRDRLDAYLDEELSAGDRAEVSRHLSGCPECRRLLEDLVAVDEAARALPAEAPEAYFDTFAPRVRERLRGARARRAFRPPIWSLAVAAALLLAVITPLTLREHATPPPATPAAASRAAAPAPAAPATPEAKDRTLAAAVPAADRDASEAPPARPNVARSDRGATDELKKEALPRPREQAPEPTRQAAANTAAAVPGQRPAAPPGAGGSAVATAEAAAKPQSHVAEQKVHLYVAEQDEATPPPPAPLAASAVVAGAPRRRVSRRGGCGSGRGPAVMNGPAAAGEARYRSLKGRTASNAEEARALRDLWRAFAASPSPDPMRTTRAWPPSRPPPGPMPSPTATPTAPWWRRMPGTISPGRTRAQAARVEEIVGGLDR